MAEHWLVWAVRTLVGEQETLTDVIVGTGVIVTLAEPDLVESWEEVALMVSDPEGGTVEIRSRARHSRRYQPQER